MLFLSFMFQEITSNTMMFNSAFNRYLNRSGDNLYIIKNYNVRMQLRGHKGIEAKIKVPKRGFERLRKLLIRDRVSVNVRVCIYTWQFLYRHLTEESVERG